MALYAVELCLIAEFSFSESFVNPVTFLYSTVKSYHVVFLLPKSGEGLSVVTRGINFLADSHLEHYQS